MTTIRITRDITNIAQEPRRIRKDFDIGVRDLVADPIEPGEVLHLGAGDLEAGLVVQSVDGGDPPAFTVAAIVQPGLDVAAKVNMAATAGWTVER